MTPTTTPMAAWLESAWLARYLDRQLSDDEAAWFEAYLLDKPELMGMVEADNKLRDSLDAYGEKLPEYDDFTASGRPGASHSASMPHVLRSVNWLSLVASIALGFGVGWLLQGPLISPSREMRVIANPTHLVYDTMRGATSGPIVQNSQARTPYVFIEIAVPPGAQEIVLDIDGKTVGALYPSADGFVGFLAARDEFDRRSKAAIRYSIDGKTKSRELSLLNPHTGDIP